MFFYCTLTDKLYVELQNELVPALAIIFLNPDYPGAPSNTVAISWSSTALAEPNWEYLNNAFVNWWKEHHRTA